MANAKVIELILVAKNLMGDGVDSANKDVESLKKSVDELSKSTDASNKRNNESQADFEKRTKRTADALEKQIKAVEKSQDVQRRGIGLSKEDEKRIKARERELASLGKREKEREGNAAKRAAALEKELRLEQELLKAQAKRVTFKKNAQTGIHESTDGENIIIKDMGKDKTNRYVAENTVTGKRKRGTQTLNQAKLAAQELSASSFAPELKALKAKIGGLQNDLFTADSDLRRTQNRRLELEYDAQTYLSDQATAYDRAINNEEKLQKIQQDGELRKESKELLSYRKRKLELDKLDTELNGRLVRLRGKKLSLEKQGVDPGDPVLGRLVGEIKDTKQARDVNSQKRKELADDKAHVQYLEAERNAYTDINLAHEEALKINEKLIKEEAAAEKKRKADQETRFAAQAKFLEQEYNKAHADNDKLDKERAKRGKKAQEEFFKYLLAQDAAEKDRIDNLLKGESLVDEKRRQLFKKQADEAKLRLKPLGDKQTDIDLDANISKQRLLEKEITDLGGAYDDLTDSETRNYHSKVALEEVQSRALLANAKETAAINRADREKKKSIDADRKVVKSKREVNRETDRNISLFQELINTWRKVGKTGGDLSRRLGRLGLAIRGLAIVGVLAFARSVIATFSALAGSAIALAGSLVYAAGALGGTFTAAAAQAIPVVGLLVAAFSRLSAIQEAMNQTKLNDKQNFGPEQDQASQAVDNTDAIADANRSLQDAQEGVIEAQKGVTDARKEAKDQLQELIYKEREAELAMRGSVLSFADAQRALREAVREGDTEGVAQAQLDVASTRFDVGQSKRDLTGARKDRRKGNKLGVKGNEDVKAAQKAVADAIEGVADAQRGLARAHETAATSADTQAASERNLAYALSLLSPAERALFKQLQGLKARFAKAFRPITDIIIKSLSQALGPIQKLLFSPEILGAFTNLATVIGDSIGRIAKVLTGPEFSRFFTETIGNSAKNLPTVTTAFIQLAKIFANIATASAPVLNKLLHLIVGELKNFVDETGKTNKLTAFFEDGLEHLRAWYRLVKAVVGLFGELMGASGDSALGTLESLTDNINKAKDALKADDSGAKSFFEDAAKSMEYVGKVLVAIGEAFIDLSGSEHVKALADILIDVLIPGITDGIKAVGYFAIAIDKIIEIPFIGTMLRWAVAGAIFTSAWASIFALFKPLYMLMKGFFTLLGKGLLKIGFIDDIAKIGKGNFGKGALSFFKQLRVEFALLRSLLSGKGILIGLRAFSKSLLGIPVAGWLVAAVIEVLVGMFLALKDNFLGIRDILMDNLGGIADEFKAIFGDLGDSVSGVGEIFGAISDGNSPLAKFLNILWQIVKAAFKVVGWVGKIIGTLIIMKSINAILVPLKGFLRVIRAITKAIAAWIQNLADLVKGDISFGEFLKRVGGILLTFLVDVMKAAGGVVWDSLKNIGKLVWNALGQGLRDAFSNIAQFMANLIVDVIGVAIGALNKAVDIFNKVSPFKDLSKFDTNPFDTEEKTGKVTGKKGVYAGLKGDGPAPRTSADNRGRGSGLANDEEDAKGKNKRAKATKNATDFTIRDYKALGKHRGVSKTQLRLNNMLTDSLKGSSKAHKRAQNLQEALAAATGRAAKRQKAYADAVRGTAKAENRLSAVLLENKKSRVDSNSTEHTAVKIKDNLSSATKSAMRIQQRSTDAVRNGSKAQEIYNDKVKSGTKYTRKYEKAALAVTKQSTLETAAIRGLAKKMGALNGVLQTTGENSRALGMVFKDVTNKVLKEFGVKELKIELPSVDGMFKQAGGSSDAGYQRGGYFGDKRHRSGDDRSVQVAGGEAMLTGHHQREANRALAVSHAMGFSPYDSLDTMFARDKRAHASSPLNLNAGKNSKRAFQRGGRSGGNDAAYAWRGISPAGLKDAIRLIAGDLMANFPAISVTSTTGGSHAANSNHYTGEAVDLGSGNWDDMLPAAAWASKKYGRTLAEGIHNPNLSIANGAVVPSSYWGADTWAGHANHIHLAALGGAITAGGLAAAGGGMTVAPKLPKRKLKGRKSAAKSMLQGQFNKTRNAANAYLQRKISVATGGAAGGGLITLSNIDSFQDINHVYAEHNSANGDWGGEQLPHNVIAALAESVGVPGETMADVTVGESNGRPGATGVDPGGTKGFGLWMITNGYNDAIIAKYGGETQMRNPINNAKAMAEIYKGAPYGLGTSKWYGANGAVDGQHYEGPMPGAAGPDKKKRKHQTGGMVPTFHNGIYEIGREHENDPFTKAYYGLKNHEIMAKLEYGETVVPKQTRRSKVGQGIGTSVGTTNEDQTQKKIAKINKQINKFSKKFWKKRYVYRLKELGERLIEAKDEMLLIDTQKEYDAELKTKRKEIRDAEKELEGAKSKKAKKKAREELAQLNLDLKDIKTERRMTRVFEGGIYNTDKIQDFMLLITDRIAAAFRNIEDFTNKTALATATWTYGLRKVNGKQIVTRIHSATKESVRALTDLKEIFGEIMDGLRETARDRKKTIKRIRDERKKADKDIRDLKKGLVTNAPKDETKKEREERRKANDAIRKDIEKRRKTKKDDLQKLRTSLNNIDKKREELLGQRAGNLAARYEAQQTIFDAVMGRFDQKTAMKDTQIEIATALNSDSEGELTAEGKKQVKDLLVGKGDLLGAARKKIQARLDEATKAKDVELQLELQQALLDNQLAMINNTESIKELDKTVDANTDAFTFRSTNWEMFRNAIQNGNGQVLPSFMDKIPKLASGGHIKTDGLAYLHAAEVVVPAGKTGNGGVNIGTIEFTEPMEVADPVALSNQIGFKLSTLRSNV